MKKLSLSLFLLILLMLHIVGCKSQETKHEITIFAASSLTESLTEIADVYTAQNDNIELVFNFDSSGTLKTQLEEGAECDIFISASQTPMDALECVLCESRINLLENKVALVVSNTNTKDISSFEDMVELLNSGDLLLAIGNEDVPVGEYTLKIFDYFNLDEEYLNTNYCLTYGSNVKEVTTQVSEGLVDCGIVYQTDATSANLNIVDTADEEMCGRVVYPAAVIEDSVCIDESIAFLEFLKSEQASQIFKKYGFTTLL